MQIQDQLQDHEERIRKLEENDVRQQVQLANIEKGNSEIKLMINETAKEQQKAYKEVTEKLVETFTQNVRNDDITRNQNSKHNIKHIWITISALVGILSAIVTHFFG